MSWREALPGAIAGAVVLEVSFLALPFFVRHANVNVTLRTLGGPAILIVWLYVMANVIVFGAEINWWWRERLAALRRTRGQRRSRAAREQRRRGHGASLRLPLVPELRDRPLLAVRDEDRVVAEALAAARRRSAIRPSSVPVPRSSRPSGARRTSSET